MKGPKIKLSRVAAMKYLAKRQSTLFTAFMEEKPMVNRSFARRMLRAAGWFKA